jgi:oligopeptide transport system substrate-binding protein
VKTRSTAALRVAVLAAVGLLATACLQEAQDLPKGVVAAPAAARAGGTLTVAIATPTSIDPALVPPSDAAGTLIVRTMCDSLFALDPTTGDIRPDLASSYFSTNRASTFTIHLRRGLRFSDGRRVTSADVVASLERVARPKVASPNASMLEDVAGYAIDQQGDPKTHDKLAGVSVVDPTTVDIGLSLSNDEFPRVLASSVGVVIPRHFAKDNGFGSFSTNPVCVGPYKLLQPWHPGDASLTLVRDSHYDGGDPGDTRAGRGWVDRIVFRIYPTVTAAYDAYVAGQADVAQVAASSHDAAVSRVGAASIATAPDPTLLYIGLPTTVPPFTSADVRLGMWQALDANASLSGVYHGGRTPTAGLFPPVVGASIYRPGACAGQPSRITAAHAALNGLTLPFYFDDEFANRAIVSAVAAMWHRAFGVTFRLTPMDFADYLQKASTAPGLDGPFRLSYASPASSAYDYVHDLLLAASVDVSNDTRFVDQTLETLVAKHAATATNESSAATQWQRVEDEFCRQMPLLPLGINNQVWAWRSRQLGAGTGSLLDRGTGLPLLREVYRR